MALRTALAFVVFASALAGAAPFLPTDDAQVLERLPDRQAPALRAVRTLQSASASAPDDLARATALASADVAAARSEGDPRYLGYAQAALAPWWKDVDAPTTVLVLRATIRQSRHEFDAALADLDRVIAREPRNAQALLTRATVLTVQGKYRPARADCEALAGRVREVYAVVCAAAIDSVTGHASAAYDQVRVALDRASPSDRAARGWAESLLGEIAHRRGDPAAERHFRAALEADRRDLYALGAYADWLLDVGRASEVIPLLRAEGRIDPLLLRLALAQRREQAGDAKESVATLDARFAAATARGDNVHLREHARFALYLHGDRAQALALARENWKVQREPADLRLLAETAIAANDAPTLSLVRAWLADTGLEYRAVAEMLAKGAEQ